MAKRISTFSAHTDSVMTQFHVTTTPPLAVQMWFSSITAKEDGTILKVEPSNEPIVASLSELEAISPGITAAITAIADHFNPLEPDAE